MARSTCSPDDKCPSGMKAFRVLRSTIRDSASRYCVPGDLAFLSRKEAQDYLNKNFIRVELPTFDDDDGGQSQTEAADDVSGSGSDGEAGTEGDSGEAEDHPRQSRSRRSSRTSTDG